MTAMLLAIDPGPAMSAWVLYDAVEGCVIDKGKDPNFELLGSLLDERCFEGANRCAIEMIASYGMPVGREVFDTCVWIGRYIQAWTTMRAGACDLVYRKDVKLHLCGQARAKDANIRQALIDRFGGKDKAIGRKANPGPLYGVTADVWSALAIAVTVTDQQRKQAA